MAPYAHDESAASKVKTGGFTQYISFVLVTSLFLSHVVLAYVDTKLIEV